ncbi:uncharacterized protein LOC18421552 [Amborella trichopoda]|uniref:RCC1-like domain-containing protein n=1 Tax=Amborella trichopoda TaxID=13333 RepID=W1NDI7_AMBTC|nr:uncharacterized protein LOC18421552 [Amborella trichopoda]XP_020526883.1 uncharacterized protein LOC18421552 [Amborella trichopoda]ERM93597.1 hypothetical protein AMTR_s00004p00125790 [Amborella trichopoda]|eukprot:XP_006826360.1 uncharacterized protein LOC18421552 [Amborella trichopoda]
MEVSAVHSGSQKQLLCRKLPSFHTRSDIWSVAREGSISDLDNALIALKKNGGNIDARNSCGLTPLHIATWRNHLPIVRRLLAAGADPDARDGESGWSSLHRALHFGHLAVAGFLIESGASLTLEDSKYRVPIDLLSGPVKQAIGNGDNSVATEVFSWGNGANYQLGTGNAHIQKLPCKVDTLHGSCIKIVGAAKFHSLSVAANGDLYTWGFGRGGRLGHPDFDIHSGQAAVITPRQVISILGSRQIKAVAAAKHHTVIATEGGEVFTWGSNREGQLGYTSVDTQPTPRRVSSLKAKVIAVAAANKHTAVVSESGEVFTWGCNKEGQLGYGTSNSGSNYNPRVVEYLKGKVFKAVSAAKYHTIVLGSDGEVFTWGHKLVTPRRVMISRNTKKRGTVPLKFHRKERLHVVAVAAGSIHSTALTEDGAVFFWVCSDPDIRCQQLYSMCGRSVVSISAGKFWTAAVTTSGDVYVWDGKKFKDEAPVPSRLHGVKRATSVAVGETHLLVTCALYSPDYIPKPDEDAMPERLTGDVEELDEDFVFSEDNSMGQKEVGMDKNGLLRSTPTLKCLCEKVAADFLLEPRNSIQLLEIADALEADSLRKHCEDLILRNLDFIFAVSAPSIASASPEILAKLEKSLDKRSSEPWCYRRLPTPTATFPAIINSEEEGDSKTGCFRLRNRQLSSIKKAYCRDSRAGEGFLQQNSAIDQAMSKQVRALKKKLQQIEILEAKQSNGIHLDEQQLEKVRSKWVLADALAELGVPMEMEEKAPLVGLDSGKGGKKGVVSKKNRRKSQQKTEVLMEPNLVVGFPDATSSPVLEEPNLIVGFPDFSSPAILEEKEDGGGVKLAEIKAPDEVSFNGQKSNTPPQSCNQSSNPTPLPKKKKKKGGLSVFLSGALDDIPKEEPSPPPRKSEGPAWGGAKISKGFTSLRDIQSEQSHQTKESKSNNNTREKGKSEEIVEGGSGSQIRLSSFLPGTVSSPIPVGSGRGAQASVEGEKSTPPWAGAGSSPGLSRPSLRDIQMQQEKKHSSHSPKTRISGFQANSPDSSKEVIPNRWFKPEAEAPSSLRSIQIEEKAIKEFKRYYSSVKLVKQG